MNTRSRGVAVSIIGYLCLGIGVWMISMTNADWYSRSYSSAVVFPLAIVLAVMGILAFAQDRAFDAVVFFGGGALLGSVGAYIAAVNLTRMSEPLSYMGWFACMWGVYFLCAWAGSLRSGVLRSSFLLGMSLTLGCLAIGGWSAVQGWMIVGGYLGLITSTIAFGVAGSESMRYGRYANQNLEVMGTTTTATTTTTARPMAAD
jgi:uncharacterized protein